MILETPDLLTAVLVPALIFAAGYDLKYNKIPNLLNFPLAGIALIYHTIFFGLDGLLFSGAGLLLGTAIFLPFYIFGGMGAGDAKLMGAVGAVVGAKGVFISALLTAIYGGLYAVFVLLIYSRYGRALVSRTWAVVKTFILTRQYIPVSTPHPVQNRPRLCYGVAIALGTLTYLVLDYLGHEFM